MNIEIREWRENDRRIWDEYALNNGTFFHSLGWKNAIESTYHFQHLYLYAENDNGCIVGFLPMFITKDIYLRKKLVSIPFAPYAGICCDDLGIANRLASEAKINGQCELRNMSSNIEIEGFIGHNLYSTFALDLSKGINYIWSHLNRKTRNLIRKAEKNELEFSISSSYDRINQFYDLYSHRMKCFGTPVHDKKFFCNIYRFSPENVLISNVKLKGNLIASLYLLKFRDTLISGWGSSRPDYLKFAPNDFIYWRSIVSASRDLNLNIFDFGRSMVNSGNYLFKKQWGAKEMPLSYNFYPRMEIPYQMKLNTASKVWMRIPIGLANKIGPRVRRYIP